MNVGEVVGIAGALRRFLRRLAGLYGAGLVLAFFSEFYFLNEDPVQSLLASFAASPIHAGRSVLVIGAYYAFFAFPFLAALSWFDVRNLPGVVLAAALYGLATEGLVVPAVYEAPPFSFLWTSLTWHVVIDVILGFVVLRRAMRGGWAGYLAFLLGLGAVWGPWATWFWGESPESALTLAQFATVAWFSSAGLALGLYLIDRFRAVPFRPSPVESAVVGLGAAALFAMTSWPYFPWPLFVLGVVAVLVGALYANRAKGTATPVAACDPWPGFPRYAAVALVPASATAAYALTLDLGVRIDPELVVLTVIAAGTLVCLWAIAAAFLARR